MKQGEHDEAKTKVGKAEKSGYAGHVEEKERGHGNTEKAMRRKRNIDIGRVIQLEEYRAFTPGVASSNLAAPTSNTNRQANSQELISLLARVKKHGGVVKRFKTPGFEPGMRRFESCLLCHHNLGQ